MAENLKLTQLFQFSQDVVLRLADIIKWIRNASLAQNNTLQ